MQINVFGQTTRNGIEEEKHSEENSYGIIGEPKTSEGKNLLKDKYAYLLKMSDSQLLDVMWESRGGLNALDYLGGSIIKKALKINYKKNSGREFSIDLSDGHWKSSKTNNRNGIMKQIQDATQREFDRAVRNNSFFCKVECSNILDRAKINFRTDADNLSLAIPMGGVQHVVLRSVNVEEPNNSFISKNYHKPNFMDSLVSKKSKEYEITLEIRLRDRFGVDTDDFAYSSYSSKAEAGKSIVTALGREALTAFWILQHQRGFRPFVWNAIFYSTIRVYQLVKR